MNHAKNHACNCTNCPGAGCKCGCQGNKIALWTFLRGALVAAAKLG